MTSFNNRVLSFATVILLIGGSAIAQTNYAETPKDKLQQLQAQDPATYTADDNTYTLPWMPIRERDISWKKRVWRSIDVSDAANKALGYDPATRNSTLISVLLEGVFNDKIKAYSSETDRFMKELTKEELKTMITPGKGNNGFNMAEVTRYNIKEDWLFIPKENKMVVRIIGIAPVREVTGADGKVTEQPLFWVYYSDSRAYLAQHKVVNSSKNWDETFEARDFKSRITKVSGGEMQHRVAAKQ